MFCIITVYVGCINIGDINFIFIKITVHKVLFWAPMIDFPSGMRKTVFISRRAAWIYGSHKFAVSKCIVDSSMNYRKLITSDSTSENVN